MYRAIALALSICLFLIQPPPASAQPDFKIVVDPRIELLSAVEILADYEWAGLITKHESAYAQELRAYFEPYRDHKAVTLFTEMSKNGFAYDAPVAAIFHLGSPPQLKPIVKMDPIQRARAGGADKLNEFHDALSDFAVDSKFQAFFDDHRTFYDKLVAIANAEAKAEGVDVADLEEYHGIKQTSYRLILAPMLHSGGFGPRVLRDDGSFDVYMVTGPRRLDGDQPVFPKGSDLHFLTMHEFGHSFINPLVESHGTEFDNVSALLEPIREQMSSMAYGQWPTCVHEHIVRAAGNRMYLAKHGEEAYKKVTDQDKERGFIYIEEISAALARYETSRDEYPTFADFFPEVIGVFEDAMKDAGLEMGTKLTGAGLAEMNPKIIKTWPDNGATDVDPTTTQIAIEFDQDMHPRAWAWTQGSEPYPETIGDPTWVTPRINVMPVKLEPNTSYWIGLNYAPNLAFQNMNRKMAEEFIFTFTTGNAR